ncbi:MAG: YggS family pyridoxal phosphate-dependent enzyme [Planctomycetaceae bacterium]|nr:YggS family pyridoxal phosphate-dependent enzyme [Planctomycetaceae bacterium]
MALTKNRILKNLQQIRQNIAGACRAARRSEKDVSIVAVTKSGQLDAVKALLEAGVTDVAESRAQILAERAEAINAWIARRRSDQPLTPRWHMVGTLQRNKVRKVLPFVQVVHSVDSLRLAEEINARAEKDEKTVDILLQVNCTEEPQKSGCAVGAALHMAELAITLKSVRLVGLMTIGPTEGGPEGARAAFVRLRELFEEIRSQKIGGPAFKHLSMGMSDDYPLAVAEGATMLRIGRALFAQ